MFRCPLPPCITRRGFDCAGAGFAIGGQSALFTTTVPWRQPTRHLGGSLVRQVDSQLVAPRQHMSLARSPTWTPACFAARLPLVRHAHLGNS